MVYAKEGEENPLYLSRADLEANGEPFRKLGKGDSVAIEKRFEHNGEAYWQLVDGMVTPARATAAMGASSLWQGVKLEFDVGWLAVAGMDPVGYLRRYAGRVLACHMKDYDPAIAADIPDRKLVEPGAGTIDFGGVLATMRETKVAHAFIEVDYAADPFGAVERGLRHLQEVCA